MPKRINSVAPTSKSPGKTYVVVLTTCGTRREADRIARSLVTARLAARVNISSGPLRSIYRWKGKIEKAGEFLLMIKSSRHRLPALQAEILRLHSYKVPEFLVLPVSAGSSAYLAWLDEALSL